MRDEGSKAEDVFQCAVHQANETIGIILEPQKDRICCHIDRLDHIYLEYWKIPREKKKGILPSATVLPPHITSFFFNVPIQCMQHTVIQ